MPRIIAAASALLLAVTIAGCSSAPAPGKDGYVSANTITIATSPSTKAPWFIDNNPASGRGFEAAVAYAVAEDLGFTKDHVVWVRVSRTDALAPGHKKFDFYLGQVPISSKLEKSVDLSSGYYLDPATGKEFALVFAKHSPLTLRLTMAVDEVRAQGTFRHLAQEWL
ncbi:MAG: hypothetical protein EPN91_09690 [Salinibacterium sp.]|nr:MAG: hypothetical protein EPN91_09690 [Salinibacterium sp.]